MIGASFSQLLEQLRTPEEEGDERLSEPGFKVSDGVGLMVLALTPQKKPNSQQVRPRYEEIPEEPQSAQPFSLGDLASEIGKVTSAGELRRLRRQFARLSHPDRCRDSSAASEMAAANRLIDDALASLCTNCGQLPLPRGEREL